MGISGDYKAEELESKLLKGGIWGIRYGIKRVINEDTWSFDYSS